MITATTNSAAPCSAPCIAAANDQTLSLTPAAPRRSTPAWPRIFAPAPGNTWTKAICLRRPTKPGGLVAETVKVISAHYGSVIHTYRTIVAVIDELSRLAASAGDTETRRRINISFAVARSLHTNFYENEMHENIVRDSLELCDELSRRLYQLFSSEGAPPDDAR